HVDDSIRMEAAKHLLRRALAHVEDVNLDPIGGAGPWPRVDTSHLMPTSYQVADHFPREKSRCAGDENSHGTRGLRRPSSLRPAMRLFTLSTFCSIALSSSLPSPSNIMGDPKRISRRAGRGSGKIHGVNGT